MEKRKKKEENRRKKNATEGKRIPWKKREGKENNKHEGNLQVTFVEKTSE